MRRLAPLLVFALTFIACGPKPTVESATVEAPQEGKATVAIVVRNDSGGEGQIEVKLTLRDAAGAIVTRKEEVVTIRARERLRFVVEVPVGAARDLKVEAEAIYPPD